MSDVIRATVQPDHLRAEPGEEVQAAIEVQNAGQVVDAYSVQVVGLDFDWYQLSTSRVSLFPGDNEVVNLTIRPPAGCEAIAKSYQLAITVASSVSLGEETRVDAVLEVAPSYTFDLEIRPEKATGAVGHYNLSITNTGNAPIAFDLEGSDPEGFCRCSFQPSVPEVAPGEKADVAVTVKPGRRPFLDPPRTYDLAFVAAAQQTLDRPTLHAQLDALPWAHKWYFPAALVILGLMALLAYSVYWSAFERNDLTILRHEKWDDVSKPVQVGHGSINSFEFKLESRREGATPIPISINLRADLTWADTGDEPPTVAAILRDPNGLCWGPKVVDRTGDPINFNVFERGVACASIDYGRLLLDITDPEALTPAVYLSGEPLVEYCVRDRESNPVVKFFRNGQLQTTARVAANPTNNTTTPFAPKPSSDRKTWQLYVVNPHRSVEFPVAPEVTLRLKSATTDQKHGWKKDETYKVTELKTAPHRRASSSIQCIWDDEIEVPGGDGGLMHGIIYVRQLQVQPRLDGVSDEVHNTSAFSLAGCPTEIKRKPGTRLSRLCGDVTWEKEAADSGKITASEVFIILRRRLGDDARCWSKFEEHLPGDHEGTPFAFDLIEGGRPCREDLTSPKQNLWNLINWNKFTPSQYEGVQPLVKFCTHPSGQTLFGKSTAIPLVDEESWGRNQTSGWTLYIMNPSSNVEPPKATVKLKGDENWKVTLEELPNPTLGDTPLVPPGSGTCPADG